MVCRALSVRKNLVFKEFALSRHEFITQVICIVGNLVGTTYRKMIPLKCTLIPRPELNCQKKWTGTIASRESDSIKIKLRLRNSSLNSLHNKSHY